MWFAGIIKGKVERFPTGNLIANASALKNRLHVTIAIPFTTEAFFDQPKWKRQGVLLSGLFSINNKCSALKYNENSTHSHNISDPSKRTCHLSYSQGTSWLSKCRDLYRFYQH